MAESERAEEACHDGANKNSGDGLVRYSTIERCQVQIVMYRIDSKLFNHIIDCLLRSQFCWLANNIYCANHLEGASLSSFAIHTMP